MRDKSMRKLGVAIGICCFDVLLITSAAGFAAQVNVTCTNTTADGDILRQAGGSNLPAPVASDSWNDDWTYTGDPIHTAQATLDGNSSANSGTNALVIPSSAHGSRSSVKILRAHRPLPHRQRPTRRCNFTGLRCTGKSCSLRR
jgi:hypothetical protein